MSRTLFWPVKTKKIGIFETRQASNFSRGSVCEIKTFNWEEMKLLVLDFGDPYPCGLNVLRYEKYKSNHPLEVLANYLFFKNVSGQMSHWPLLLVWFCFCLLFLSVYITHSVHPECASWLAEWSDSSCCNGCFSTLYFQITCKASTFFNGNNICIESINQPIINVYYLNGEANSIDLLLNSCEYFGFVV